MKNELINALTTLTDMQAAARAVAPTFGIMPDQVVALFLIAQAEGLHPMAALRIYHIIEGKPAMRADAMQAKFQERGGFVQWIETSETRACAKFSHPKLYPEPVEVALTFEEMRKRGITDGQSGLKKNWRCHAAAMLRARVISAGVRMVDPGTVVGLYTPEEIEDMEPRDAQGVVVHEPGESPRHVAIREAVATEQPAEPVQGAPSQSAPSPADTIILKPEAAKEVQRQITKPPGPAPQQTHIDKTPSGGSDVLVPIQEGEPITVKHLLDACRRFMALAGKDAGSKRLAALNTRYKCGKNEKGVAVVSLCPADSIAFYLADIEEEISYKQHESKVSAGMAAAGAPL